MAFPLFKDISKNSNDLLRKGYVTSEKYAFRVESDVTTDGVQITPHLQTTLDKNVEGELKCKFPFKDYVVTTTDNMKQDMSVEITPAKASRGFKWTLNFSSNVSDLHDKAKGKLTVEHKGDHDSSSLTFERPFKHGGAKSDDSKLLVNSVLGFKEKGVSGGFDGEISLSSLSLKSLNLALALNKDALDVTLFSKNKGAAKSVGINFFQKVKSDRWADAQVAGEVSYDLSEKSEGGAFALASSFKPTDSSSLKSRFESKGLLGFSYTDKWSGPLSVTFGSDWNVLGGNATPFQYSIKFALK